VSHDALMCWEWEGGAPAAVSERDELAHVEPAQNTRLPPQTTSRRQRTPQAAAASLMPSDGRRGDDGEG
jgi:hypothetical protein